MSDVPLPLLKDKILVRTASNKPMWVYSIPKVENALRKYKTGKLFNAFDERCFFCKKKLSNFYIEDYNFEDLSIKVEVKLGKKGALKGYPIKWKYYHQNCWFNEVFGVLDSQELKK